MIDQGFSLNSLRLEPILIAKCLVTDNVKATLRNVLALCSTSKVYQYIISSDPFFKGFVELIDPQHPLFILRKESKEKTTQDVAGKQETSFRHKYFDLRNAFLLKNETFSGAMFAEALVRKDGVELISFDNNKIVSFMLKENSHFQSIKILEDMQIPVRQSYREFPCAARSEKFLAINMQCNSAIYIYTLDGEICLAKHEVDGRICQLIIKGDLLCVVEQQPDESHNLMVFDLEASQQQKPVTIALPKNEKLWPPPRPICFGDEYLIYTQSLMNGNKIYALPLSCLSATTDDLTLLWIEGTATDEYRYILHKEDHFIEVTFNECNICDISKFTFTQEGFLKTEIAKGIVITNKEKNLPVDVCLQNDRLFLAYSNLSNITKIFSYDILSGKVAELISTSQSLINYPFKPRFLNTATNVYFLMGGLKESKSGTNMCLLTTLTYGKI